jgi:molybdopterin/thiamine biosynthesis adenylyltransferase
MSSSATAPDSPIDELLADGYALVLQHGHLVVRRIPYRAASGMKEDGKLALPVTDNNGTVSSGISDHTIWFSGEDPLGDSGNSLASRFTPPRDIGAGDLATHQLSFKPEGGNYTGIAAKVRAYARILSSPARRIRPELTATPGAAFQIVEDDLPFVYRDTNTTRAGLAALNNVFRGHTIAIVGVGGTGSYILDQVAKTWVDRILLIDGDTLENHNAFRAPGAASIETLQAKRNKAEYFAEQYSHMHTGITAHPVKLTAENVELLEPTTFVFLAAADAEERPAIMAWLHEQQKPFIDVGMSISQTDSGLTGLAKVTTYLPNTDIVLPTKPAAAPDDEYATNIQIADLNALNAILAVIRWKRHLGFYAAQTMTEATVFKLFLNEIRNGES